MREHLYFVYILASRRNGTLYVGVTNDVMRRTYQHKNDLIEGFTKKYGVHILVWHEAHDDIHAAIAREKRLKRWNRAWKIKLIEEHNSGWNDLYDRMMGEIALPDLPETLMPQTHLSSPAEPRSGEGKGTQAVKPSQCGENEKVVLMDRTPND